jgi:hypothetical protein
MHCGNPAAQTKNLVRRCLQSSARIRRGKRDAKCGAETGRARDTNMSGVFLNYSVSNSQSQSSAAANSFGREEWIVDLGYIFGGDAHTIVRNFNRYQFFIAISGGKLDQTSGVGY